MPRGPAVDRRAFLRTAAAVVVPGTVTAGCAPAGEQSDGETSPGVDSSDAVDSPARLSARVAATGQTTPEPAPGLQTLDLGPGPEVLLRVPADPDGAAPLRLVLTLHGAGQTARDGLAPLLDLADAHRLLLLAPASRGTTWDAVLGGWGPDVRRIDQALARVLATHRVDASRIAISGFSDGATYALSLGLANADLFTHVIAFSPGFLADAPRVGTPRVYLSHGRTDRVLPLDQTTRRILPQLDSAKIPTELRIFDGGHMVPPDIAEGAIHWLLS